MSDELITVDSVTKVFRTAHGKSVPALDDVSFTVTPGEFVTILGPSGCGKSTLLSAIAGLEPVSGGEITIGGTPVRRSRRDVSVVFQDPVLLPWRRVLDNVLLPIEIIATRVTKEHKDKAAELIEMVGLQGFESSYPKELSGGMQQRCAIARALMLDAPLLLMDEPFGALDALTREQLNVEIEDIWMQTDTTVVLITHDIKEAVLLSDRIMVMSERPGSIVKTFEVTTPRPRQLNALEEMEAARLTTEIRKQLGVVRPAGGRRRAEKETSNVR